jgi:hypothetical protein
MQMRIRHVFAQRALAALCLALAPAGCANGGADDLGRGSGGVVGGTVTYEHPEVGSISGCTATLVAPEIVITAAHCLGYGTRTSPGSYGSFVIERGPAERYRYTIRRYRSFGSSVGPDDIALIQLAEAVPDSIATPAPMARAYPARGSRVTIYGYGCTRRGGSSDWRKRRYEHGYGDNTARLCPGDSGGPTLTDGGEVLRINSGYWVDATGYDIFGDVPRNHARLMEQARAWSSHPVPEGPRDGGPPPPMGDAGPGEDLGDAGPGEDLGDAGVVEPEDWCQPLASSCGACTPIRGCGWCGATRTCMEVDYAGRPRRACPGGFALNPPDCSGGEGDSCGVYAPFPEYTCRRTGTGFARCRPGGTPEFLVCPPGYYCPPGSRRLLCYRYRR